MAFSLAVIEKVPLEASKAVHAANQDKWVQRVLHGERVGYRDSVSILPREDIQFFHGAMVHPDRHSIDS